MLETARERVSLLKAGVDGKTIEHLYIKLNNFKLVGSNSRKINCWEFVGCGSESGGDSLPAQGGCQASIDMADRTNWVIKGGSICRFISGTFNEDKKEGQYAKKLLSCRSCILFHKVREEEGNPFFVLKNNKYESMAEIAGSI